MSKPEEELALMIVGAGLPQPEREYRFCERRWRFDFAWPGHLVAMEVDGGVWVGGRHNRPAGYAKDAEKLNRASLDGWRVFRVTPQMVKDGSALNLLEAVFSEGRDANVLA